MLCGSHLFCIHNRRIFYIKTDGIFRVKGLFGEPTRVLLLNKDSLLREINSIQMR